VTSIALNPDGLRAIKRALVAHFPHTKSAHLSEALAAACGFGSNAALLTAMKAQDAQCPDFVLLDDGAFHSRHEALAGTPPAQSARLMRFEHLPLDHGDNVLQTSSYRQHSIDYSRNTRLRAWRNAMVAVINEALARRLFSLRAGDNRWPGADFVDRGRQKAHIFRFEIGGIPAIASLWDAGWDEISVHVAFWPTEGAANIVAASNAGFYAGEMFASGWLERREGAWLQVGSDSGSNWSFRCRRNRLAQVASLALKPSGYADHGLFAC
jgi:hypothetical protein